jgi:uncharacterized protein (UPF0335 family)
MPRSAKLADDPAVKTHMDERASAAAPAAQAEADGEPAARPGANGYDGAKLMGFVRRVEAVQAEIDTIMANAQDACEPHRQDIAQIRKDAAEEGFSKKEFATVLRKRRLEQKLEHVADSLDEPQRESFEMMMEALGQLVGTPLGDVVTNGASGH